MISARHPSRFSSRRRFRAVMAASALAALATASLVAVPQTSPTAAAVPPRPSHAGRVQVLTPLPKSVVVAPNRAAAARTRLNAALRVTGGSITRLTVKLNGRPVRAVAARTGVQRIRLDQAVGLRVGQNLLWVSATFGGSTTPVQVADRFVIGYRVKSLLVSSGVRLGAGVAPAARVRVRAPLARVNQTSASLNRRTVHLPEAQIGRHGRRLLDLNLAQLGRLRAGRNQLDLRIVMHDGRVQDLRHRFTLDRRRDIAVARLVGRVAVGQTVTLDASSSRIGPGRRLQARWSLLRKPRLSQARLSNGTGRTTNLQLDVPGSYRVALRTSTGANAGYDVLTVAATYSEPLVPIDTGASQGGASGLQVGADPTGFVPYDNQPIQQIVLDRNTLEVLHANSYAATATGLGQLETDLSNNSSTDLAFVVAPDGRPLLPNDQLGNLNAALQEIGGNLGGRWSFDNSSCWSGHTYECNTEQSNNVWTLNTYSSGPFTVIGVAGMAAGQAWRETADQTKTGGGSGTGRLTGYLTQGVASENGVVDAYTVVHGPDPYLPVNTCATVGSAECAVTVGDQTYPATAGVNGFHVVVLDRTTLTLLSNQTVSTYNDLHQAINTSTSGTPPENMPVVHYVTNGGQSDQSLVIVQSVGTGKLTGSPIGYIFQDVSQLGGTPEALSSSLGGAHRYALVGAADNLPWYGTAGIESSTVMATSNAPGQPTGQINGMLGRDRTGLYTPTSGNPAGPINTELYTTLFQPAQDWPYAGDPALAYIAQPVEDGGIGLEGYPDVRSAYTDTEISFDSKATTLTTLTCTDTNACGPNFAAVKAQLLLEFPWVETVKNFSNSLLSPYTQSGDGAVFAVDAIYDDIYNSLPPPPPVSTSLNWLGIAGDAVSLIAAIAAPEAPQASAALSIVGSSLTLGSAFVQSSDGSSADTVLADAPDQLSAQLAEQQTAAVEGIDRIETILLSDYGRLSEVGTAAGGDDASWDWQPDETIDGITALNASTRAASYTSLIPEIYGATDLQPGNDADPGPPTNWYTTDDVTKYQCHDGGLPFSKALSQNQFQAVTRVDEYGTQDTLNDVWLFANKVSSGSPQMPTTSLTDNIYGPTSRGAEGAFQYAPDWWRTTFNPPGGIVCYLTLYASIPNNPPDIPLPPP